MERIPEKKKIDPADIRQTFNDVNIKLLCCRYWVLEEWDCMDLSVPFWRLYHNSLSGAKIRFGDEIIFLNDDRMVLVPPRTSFSTHLKFDHLNTYNESITGRRMERSDRLDVLQKGKRIDHLFIHFNLGFPLDYVKEGIYTFCCTENTVALLKEIQASCLDDSPGISFIDSLRIKLLIIQSLLKLPPDIWEFGKIDHRISDAMQYIEKHSPRRITNEELAERANMAINSFARLFKFHTGVSVQQYILKSRVERASGLMHHSNKTIDEIAYDCGFSDRHHFSRVFKQLMDITPAYYKKHLILT